MSYVEHRNVTCVPSNRNEINFVSRVDSCSFHVNGFCWVLTYNTNETLNRSDIFWL